MSYIKFSAKYINVRLPFVLVAIAVILVSANCTGTASTTADFWDLVLTARERIDSASLIVRAEHMGSSHHSRPIVSPVDGQPHGQVVERFDEYNVLEVIKGSYSANEPLYVNDTASITRERPDGLEANSESTGVELQDEVEYVLFLQSRPRIQTDPPEFGDLRWNIAGEPGVAVLSGDQLKFVVSEQIRKALRNRSREFPVEGSDAPFSLTLSKVREG